MRASFRAAPTVTVTALVLAGALSVSGCSTGPSAAGGRSSVIRVVAAENFWGSIAAQLGGERVQVTSIITSPDADPHAYEATAADGRAVATADLTIVNGVGYDPWAADLAQANASSTRTDLNVGDVVGARAGDNPHRWYNPADVRAMVDRIVAGYQAIKPADADYFEQQKSTFTTTTLNEYDTLIADVKARYSGTPVGASESIFAMIAPALGLDVVTPPTFLTAVSAGTDPTAADKATIDRQISTRAIRVYVYNSQNATPDVQAQVDAAQARGIPVSAITETMTPATATWEQWQTAQLRQLRAALQAASP